MESLLLVQKPNRWTARHLEVARVRVVQDVSAIQLFGDFCPEDGDSEFENVAKELCGPTREKLEQCADTMGRLTNDKRALIAAFNDIYVIRHGDVKKKHSFFVDWLDNLITGIFYEMSPETSGNPLYVNSYSQVTNLKIEVPQLSSGHIKVDGIIAKYDGENGFVTIPLATFSIINNQCEASIQISRYEVTQCLAQTVIAYSRNRGLDKYYGINITLDRTSVQISKAIVDQAYLKSLWEDGSITEDIQLYRTRKLDLLDCDDRREFSRLIVGMSRFLLGSEQSMIAEKWFKRRDMS